MNYYHLHGGSVEDGYCSPHGPPSSQPYQRRFPSLEHDLVELSWQNGGIVMNSQAQRRAAASCSEAKNLQKPEVHPKHRDPFEGSIREEDERETATWLHYPIDDPLDGDFCPEFYGLPAAEQEGLAKHDAAAPAPAEEEEGAVFGDYVFSTPSAPVLKEVVNSGGGRRGEGKGEGRGGRGEEEGEGRGGGVEGGGGGGGGEGGRNQEEESSSSKREEAETNWRKGQKRKGVDAGESECLTEEAADCESGQASRRRRRSASSRRSRAAEVHNLAERRRRDRINEKMKALQELIPHCNKSDKASMLDEAIEYLKSLQLQLQMMWMGSGMAAMMVNPMMACMGVGPPPSQGGLQYPNFFPIGQPTAAYPGLNQAAVGRTFISPVNLQSSTSANLPEPYAHLLGPTQPPSQLSQREQRAAGVLAGGLWDPAPGVDHK